MPVGITCHTTCLESVTESFQKWSAILVERRKAMNSVVGQIQSLVTEMKCTDIDVPGVDDLSDAALEKVQEQIYHTFNFVGREFTCLVDA